MIIADKDHEYVIVTQKEYKRLMKLRLERLRIQRELQQQMLEAQKERDKYRS